MPVPRIFISSTCYDLKYIRENLKYFIKNLGFEPVLSEDGQVFYDPYLHTHDACLKEVSHCQMFILIVGGRYGCSFKDSNKSITNAEYDEATRRKIPVFSLIDRSVYDLYRLYIKNKDNNSINYDGVDSIKIFEFIDQVITRTGNNAICPFSDFETIQAYLKLQWAGMMYKFLTAEIEFKRIEDVLDIVIKTDEKLGILTEKILKSTPDLK